MADKKPRAKRAAKTYKMPAKFSNGEILTDVTKNQWIVKDSIGIGGFGEIYAAAKANEPKRVLYAVKIEPHENGPLFCERSVYINIGKKQDLDEFKAAKKLHHLGIPTFHGFGSHVYKGEKYQFIVIDKLGKDVWSLYKKNNCIPYETVLKLGVQILNVLEYMHSKGYVHCDIKGANLLLGEDQENLVYVVDFGLACKYSTSDTPNPKKAHNGTIEYTSRDAHRGVMTRRGDVEILAFNLLHWASNSLPWEKLTDPSAVQKQKEEFLDKPDKLFKTCYKTDQPHVAIKEFVKLVARLKPLDQPDYEKLEEILSKELKKLKSDPKKLAFGNSVSSLSKKRKTPVKKVIVSDPDSDAENDSDSSNSPKPEPPKKVPKLRGAVSKSKEPKKSWKDCPTIVNGTIKHK